MLVDDKPFKLRAYMAASEEGAGFVVPLFSGRDSNMMFVQDVGPDGSIKAFQQIKTEKFTYVDDLEKYSGVGDQALCGFRNGGEQLIFASYDEMQEQLLPLIKSIDQPFLRLQIAQFCNDLEETIKGWSDAFEYISKQSPRSAEAWRDIVVVPAEMRRAIERVINEFDFNMLAKK